MLELMAMNYDRSIWINPKLITAFESRDSGSAIYLDDGKTVLVQETPEELVRLLNGPGSGNTRRAREVADMTDWQTIDTAPRDEVIWTKIHDEHGERNVAQLKTNKHGRLWFYPDMSMYVYYRPTHWRKL